LAGCYRGKESGLERGEDGGLSLCVGGFCFFLVLTSWERRVVAAMRAGSELSVVPKEEGGSSALCFFGERTSRKKALVFSKGGAAFCA